MAKTAKRTCITCKRKMPVREIMHESGREMCRPCVVAKYERIGVRQEVIAHLRATSELMEGPEELERLSLESA